MEERGTKNYFQLNQGLNTEANEINFPDGFTVDERNYELLLDGSRRRRKGLKEESGGSGYVVPTISSTSEYQAYVWKNVGGDPNKKFVVHKFGNELHFSDDAETVSTTYHRSIIDLTAFRVDDSTTSTQVAQEPCTFTSGRGHLLVAGKLIKPFYIEYAPSTDSFSLMDIRLRIRDFDGIEDSFGIDIEPTNATIPADHRYNLRNRGWKEEDFNQYHTDESKWPAKNMLWYRGYRRQTDASYADIDGIQAWDSNKIADEVFGNASAPQGSLFLDPLNTTYAATTSGGGNAQAIESWSYVQSGGNWDITVTATAHGYTSGEITISGMVALYIDSEYGETFPFTRLNGTHTITGTTTDTITFSVIDPYNFNRWEDQFQALGQIDGGETLTKSDGRELDVGPTAIEYHAGRVWYGGINDPEWADALFFSKIAVKPNAYGICAQEADPTDPFINSLTPADGGVIIVPGMGGVKELLSVRNSLIVFAEEGVWEVIGGNNGVFSATSYFVRKLTDAECTSPYSAISLDNGALFTGTKGIYQIGPNQFTGLLEAQNISEARIQSLWNSITTQDSIQTVYDDALKRVYFLYTKTGSYYDAALILDFRVGAWYRYEFNDGVLTAFSISESDSTEDNKKIKWTCRTADTVATTCDMEQDDYLDFDGNESPLPYMVTGWDNIGDFQRRRQAPIVTVYSKKTETGFTETGNGLDPVNESSTLMSAYWDWTDNSVSGKISNQQQVYRHVRAYQPTGSSDTFQSGYPVVVTRNKVRGRGRVLQLRFDAEAAKDTHLLGFSLNYRITKKV